ncbi:hypothetical protein OS493_006083 [Desmophyllum pertusum]|uniref:Uncharacterized protein n=1 Tax=Desmophyllum pertusum TaxID=174260 RepID=A0A9W9YFU0_9CNID|nr:hypothetical protein OS493_006083 [Desmophyllum pertusum]
MATGGMFQYFEGNKIAVSCQGKVAVVKKHENCIELYGKGVEDGIDWMARKITAGLSRPFDVCFAPNDNLVVSDIGDNKVKIYKLTGDPRQVNQIFIGIDSWNRLIVLDSFANIMEFARRGGIFRGSSNPSKRSYWPGAFISIICHK